MNLKRITVFCASSRLVEDVYVKAAEELAAEFIKYDITAIYGGGGVGLMGALADYMLNNEGKIIGVIPKFMMKVEWGHPEVKNMIIAKDMHDRKKNLLKTTDAVVALPGGVGTLEELIETITLKQLGKFPKPIIILNTNHFYDPLILFFNHMKKERFIRQEHLNLYEVIQHPNELISALENSTNWDKDWLKIAEVR